MDTITHTVLGACVGEALAGKKLGKKAMLIGAIANNFPDVDVVTSLWMYQADSLLAHRGFTHSILFVLIMTGLSGWLMKKLFPKIKFSYREWTLLIGINLFLHIIIDSFTAYGTGWFEPFSHYRVSFNILFVADPFYTIALLISAIGLLILKRTSVRRKAWANAGLIISSCYFMYALFHKIEINHIVKESLAKENISFQDVTTTPTPLNNFLWYIIAANDTGFHIGYYSVFDHSKEIPFHYVPKNDFLLDSLRRDHRVKKLVRFSEGLYCMEKRKDTLIFNDLRFGQIGGWQSGSAPFVFQYRLQQTSDYNVAIQKGRIQASGGKALRLMIERIKGN